MICQAPWTVANDFRKPIKQEKLTSDPVHVCCHSGHALVVDAAAAAQRKAVDFPPALPPPPPPPPAATTFPITLQVC